MKLVPLGEVCVLVNGGTPDTKIQEYWDGPHTWITPAEMGNLVSPFLGTSRRTLTNEGLRNSSAKLLPKHSVIMSSRAPIGHLVINEVPMASNQGCKGLIPNSDLNYKYLYYFLFANKQYLNSLGSGTTFAELSGTKLKAVEIPLPSLEKQAETVAQLDSAFAEIDLLIKQAESNLGLLRQIYHQEIESVFYRNVNGWPSTTIKESCDYKNGKAHEQLVDTAGTYRLVTSKFVSSNGKLARRVTTALTPLVSGDVAFVLSDLPNGKALAKAYLVEAEKDLTLNQRVLRVKSSKFIPKFLYLQINRHPYLLSFDNGESQTHLKLAQALSCPLLIPDLEIQKQTSERLIGLRSEVEHSEEILNKKLLMLNTLRQSLLSQAFDYSETAGLVA